MKAHRIIVFLLLVCIPGVLTASNCSWVTPPPSVTITSTYSVFSTSSYSVSNPFSFQCTPNTTATVSLTRGTNSASYNPRTAKIQNPPVGYTGALLNYNLLNTTGQIWGDGSGGSIGVTFTSVPTNKTYDQADGAVINAIAFYGQDVPPGTYLDTVTATLNWPGGTPDARSFQIQVIVIAECQVSTFTLPFGTYEPLVANATTPKDAQMNVNVQCTASTAATVGLDSGLWAGGGTRNMKNNVNGALLTYNIFTDTNRTSVWNMTTTRTGTSTSKLQILGGGFPGYGRIPAGLDVPGGSYFDTVQATVTY